MPQSAAKTMRVVEIRSPGGPEALVPATRETPRPGPGQVLIEVAAAGVNRPDVFQRKGLYPPPPGASDLPGLEVAGRIVAAGPGADRFAAGARVCALLAGGGYTEYALADEGACLRVPARLSFIEAAALPETFFTVWTNVFEDGALKAGETLLVHGGTSGIGVAAIMLAKAFGARVFATASSAEKREAIMRLGADGAFDYNEDGWDRALADEGGADVVLDMAGGDFVRRNLALLKPRGRHVSIAFLRGATAQIDIPVVMQKRLVLTGSTLRGRAPAEKARIAAALGEKVWPLLEEGRIKPVVDAVFDLADAALAHERMEGGAHIGKIILKVRDD